MNVSCVTFDTKHTKKSKKNMQEIMIYKAVMT